MKESFNKAIPETSYFVLHSFLIGNMHIIHLLFVGKGVGMMTMDFFRTGPGLLMSTI